VTTFTDRMAGVLGIHRADLKVVSLYQGSTIVDFMVFSDQNTQEVPLDLDVIGSVFEEWVKVAG